MENVKEFVAKHPYATGGIVLVGGLLILITRGGSGGGLDTTIIAANAQTQQLQAAADVEAMRLQSQQNIASQQAQVANNQIAAALEQTKITTNAAVTENKDNVLGTVSLASLQAGIYKAVIDAQNVEMNNNNELAKYRTGRAYDLAAAGTNLAKQGGRSQTGANIVALALGQGDIGSFNSSVAYTDGARSMMWANIVNSVSKFASMFV